MYSKRSLLHEPYWDWKLSLRMSATVKLENCFWLPFRILRTCCASLRADLPKLVTLATLSSSLTATCRDRLTLKARRCGHENKRPAHGRICATRCRRLEHLVTFSSRDLRHRLLEDGMSEADAAGVLLLLTSSHSDFGFDAAVGLGFRGFRHRLREGEAADASISSLTSQLFTEG